MDAGGGQGASVHIPGLVEVHYYGRGAGRSSSGTPAWSRGRGEASPRPSAARSRPDVSHAQGPSKDSQQGGESARASSSWPNNHAGRRTAAHRERASAVALTPSAEERRRGKMPAQREHSEELSGEVVEAIKEATGVDTPAAVLALTATGNRGANGAVAHILDEQEEEQNREAARCLQPAMDAVISSRSQSAQSEVRAAHHGDQTSCETVAPCAAVSQANKHSSEEATAVQSAPSATGASSSKQPKNSGSAAHPRQAGRGRGGHNGAGDQRGRGRRGDG